MRFRLIAGLLFSSVFLFGIANASSPQTLQSSSEVANPLCLLLEGESDTDECRPQVALFWSESQLQFIVSGPDPIEIESFELELSSSDQALERPLFYFDEADYFSKPQMYGAEFDGGLSPLDHSQCEALGSNLQAELVSEPVRANAHLVVYCESAEEVFGTDFFKVVHIFDFREIGVTVGNPRSGIEVESEAASAASSDSIEVGSEVASNAQAGSCSLRSKASPSFVWFILLMSLSFLFRRQTRERPEH